MSFTSELESRTLYLTISLPNLPSQTIAPLYDRDTTTIHILNPSITAKQLCADVDGTQDFEWGIYWHSCRGTGTWYKHVRLPHELSTKSSSSDDTALLGHPPMLNVMSRLEMKQSPRLFSQVVGIVRLFNISDFPDVNIPKYLDWIAPTAAAKETRSCMWALYVYFRVRKHVARKTSRVDEKADVFDGTGLMCEALQFAYREVWYAMSGQLPRPIMVPSALRTGDEKMD